MTVAQKKFLNSAFFSMMADNPMYKNLGASVKMVMKDMVRYYCYHCDVSGTRFQDELHFKKVFVIPVINEPLEVKVKAMKRDFEAM